MKKSRHYIGGVLVFLAALSTFVWVAWAQDKAASGSCCGAPPVSRATGSCPVIGGCPMKGLSLSGVAIYLDSPAALLARAEVLALTAEQEGVIQTIQAKARAEALDALTEDQKAVLGTIPVEPVMLGAARDKVCVQGRTKPYCTEIKAVSEALTLCPVMHSLISRALFFEYPGKTMNSSCPGCTGVQRKRTDKYLSNSPQFDI